jgi:hypothetical protein
MSPQTTATLIPQVFVLWHPQYQYGEQLAIRVLRWLRPGNGLGPDVFYRSLPDPSRTKLPSDLDRSSSGQKRVSNLQVIVVLVDEHMVSDHSWRRWLDGLASDAGTTRAIMPVALDATAYNMPARFRELNYLRPTDPRRSPDSPLDEAAFEVVARSLLKQLTEAMCRLILPRPMDRDEEQKKDTKQNEKKGPPAQRTTNAPLPKVNVFLSHAKKDGTGPAQRLRNYIYSQTQLAAFFDENDIAFGDVFGRVIERTLDSNDTAAMIAVRSVLYPTRPWCRRELSLFRRPRQVSTATGTAQQWRLYPTLVVEAMEGLDLSSGIPEIGNSTAIRWTDSEEGLEELIVTTVIRDAMLAAFHSALGASIPAKAGQIVINWLPDPTTLLAVDDVRAGKECVVLYPGRGLTGIELNILSEFFPHLTFYSFEEALLW